MCTSTIIPNIYEALYTFSVLLHLSYFGTSKVNFLSNSLIADTEKLEHNMGTEDSNLISGTEPEGSESELPTAVRKCREEGRKGPGEGLGIMWGQFL